MTDILYLVHRLPFPPNKGDKIRSFHLLKFLAERYSVHLGCFADQAGDDQYVDEIKRLCSSLCVRPQNGAIARLAALRGFVTSDALTVPYYYDRRLADWVGATVQQFPISAVVAFSSPMAQYVLHSKFDSITRIMDFVDIDSDKWRQYAEHSRLPNRWIYSREASLLRRFERRIARDFDASVFVSEYETAAFAEQLPEVGVTCTTARNGVAVDYFDPSQEYESPYHNDHVPIVFTGMMDYLPNIDAMTWFSSSIFKSVRQSLPNAHLWIVGASPTQEVLGLGSIEGVTVTGRVDDVRPYLKHAAVVIAPMRMGRGVQNKVLEALAMGKPVVCTDLAANGLAGNGAAPVSIGNSESELAEYVARLAVDGEGAAMSAREYVLRYYDWQRNLQPFELLIEGGGAPIVSGRGAPRAAQL